MKVVIAEKPSAAREIAAVLGAREKKDGYLTGNGYFVTWSLGHLVGLGMPEDYGIRGFDKSSLPILPNPFLLTVRKQKGAMGYIADAAAINQLKIIEHLISCSDNIIAATDAGREGELIFRYIYEYLKCNKPFERLWISSLTEKAIRKGLENLKPGCDFDGLYKAAESRSRADWLVGINASQALSIATGGIYSLGRVQTPTLALICRRYLENKSFHIEQYWQIKMLHTREFIQFESVSQNKWKNKKQAQDALKAIERSVNTAFVSSVKTKTVTEQPPLLFDLTGLQKEANRKLNLPAEETLRIAQSLYEKKYISYPRTGSKYIPKDLWAEIPVLIKVLQLSDVHKKAAGIMKLGCFNKRIVDDLRVTDHHGLLITDKIPLSLTGKEKSIYNMIAFRLIESISQACTKEITEINLEVLHYDFIIKGCKVIDPGWRSVRGNFFDDAQAAQQVPVLKKGEELKIKESSVLEINTRPPLLYSEADLLAAMQHAGKAIEDPQERKALENIGIGTPATRASIIETLLERNYIERQNKSLIPTQKGLQVYELVKDKNISDAAMSAEWEMALQKIENGQQDADYFQNEMQAYVSSITSEFLNSSFANMNLPDLICPRCKRQLLILRDKIVKCPDNVCGWVQFRQVCGIHLTLPDIESIVNTGRTSLIRGMKSRTGKTFDAYIVLNQSAESSFEFEKKTKKQ